MLRPAAVALRALARHAAPRSGVRGSSVSTKLTGTGFVKNPEKVAELYGSWGSENYDADVMKWGYKLPQLAAEYTRSVTSTEIFEGTKILDAGAGTGLLAYSLKEAGVKDATAIDICTELLSKAMKSGFYSCCKVVDLKATFDFPDSCFDVTLCLGTLTYMDPEDSTMSELLRVTRTGGIVVFSMRTDHISKWEGLLKSMLAEGSWEHLGTSDAFDYLPANPDYGDNVLVKVFVYKKK